MDEVRATLRLQFHRGFTLDDAIPLVPYFAELGISHLYCSPLFTARPGSSHGYDVVDPTTINPELGGESALERLVEALRRQRMGLILDLVPNHMAVGGDRNPWWLDVLEWGQASPYANFFDIQWQSSDPLLDGQLLAPFLANDYAEVLSAGGLQLGYYSERGGFAVRHFDHLFPLSPPTWGEILRSTGDPDLSALAQDFDRLKDAPSPRDRAQALKEELARLVAEPGKAAALDLGMDQYRGDNEAGMQRLHELLERQTYRVASWRTAADDINWRRFFDINELGGLRVERAEVFEATHAKLFELVARGLVDGLRIDHVDGLADPRGYCRRLRRRVEHLLDALPRRPPFPIYVEKILGHGEHLPLIWGVDGTTGYDFMNEVSLLQHDPMGELRLCALWTAISGRSGNFPEESQEARRLLLTSSLAGDVETVAQGLLQIARGELASRDLTLGAIRRALVELVAHFPVYRTYAGACGRSYEDEGVFQRALNGARTSLSPADWPLLDYLDRWLGAEALRDIPPGPKRRLRRQVLQRFQQLTSPAAAKAVEDTACYRSIVLLSRNDVGFGPEHFSAPLTEFHCACLERAARFPNNLLATATHDHKRGEDARARLAVLSERSDWFFKAVQRWRRLADPLRAVADDEETIAPADELALYQTVLGSWPPGLSLTDADGMQGYLERLQRWQEKFLREARLRSSWSAPNQPYEAACRVFLARLLESPEGRPLRKDLLAAVTELAPAGALNGLVQCLLRMTTPGVPDLYQGTEFWDFSLVDPDNRQEVDFAARIAGLADHGAPQELLRSWENGHIKQRLVATVLNLRQKQPLLFSQGSYEPLEVEGPQAERVLAFARCHELFGMVVVAPRLASTLLDGPLPQVPPQHWADTRIKLPRSLRKGRLSGAFSSRDLVPRQNCLGVADLLADFPVNLLLITPSNREPQP
ncbi:malto-oligosyltrehalose synthase [Pseudomonas taiwanensis]|uniref:malto-oligosyltrehalose synthase n=1 Tax=Pseudomonas taiwanensis TaxID=470150 RepID=UPI0015BDB4A5|nr:malto-oligosyltrehalose synthase [Pseudomonas taiwanensis]NWL76491.1 malto-oligosyltrehalose synthase [Pseudomonas taiwanensis]